ncbi:hypothetical protein L6452_40113 [Arctium lappa]|uniref:Uncharacterized protein n=1 Tax=Arctium lappa TaxID=4217 RepID=A0ACB8XKE8_ARCLA|nr:hypothetical protein L6452_40113 [Arctium lappa]
MLLKIDLIVCGISSILWHQIIKTKRFRDAVEDRSHRLWHQIVKTKTFLYPIDVSMPDTKPESYGEDHRAPTKPESSDEDHRAPTKPENSGEDHRAVSHGLSIIRSMCDGDVVREQIDV